MQAEDDELEAIRKEKMKKMQESLTRNNQVMSKPVEITDRDFEHFLKKHSNVVVDCWAPWCGPCRAFAPVLESAAKDYAGKIVFGKLNVDDNPHTAEKFGITGIPTILAFKDGKLVERIVGAMPYNVFKQRLSQLYGV